MCKKIGIAAIAVVAGLLIVNHTAIGHKIKQVAHNGWEKVHAQVVKPEDEIKSLKEKLNDFGPKLHEQLNKMAEVKVEQMKLEKAIVEQTARLERQKVRIVTLRDELKSETVKVRNENSAKVKAATLDSEFRSYQVGEESLKVKKQLLEHSKDKYAAAEANFANMQAMKLKLEGDLAQLEVRLEIARARETQNLNQFEDEQLGDIKEEFAKLEQRITRMEIISDLEGQYLDTAKEGTSKKASVNVDNLLKEIEEQFPGGKVGSKVAERE